WAAGRLVRTGWRCYKGPRRPNRAGGPGTLPSASRQDPAQNVSGHVRQTEVAPAIAIGQPLMVQPQQMQNGGVIVVHMARVRHNLRAELVGLAMGDPALDAPAGEQTGEGLGVMVPALA